MVLTQETVTPVIIAALTGGFAVAVVQYFRELPITVAKAKQINQELSVILIEKIKEYNVKLEERLQKAEGEIEKLRGENDRLIQRVYQLEYELRKYTKNNGNTLDKI